MRAAVMTEPDRPLEILDLAQRGLRSSEVHVRIDASGVCHSDETIRREGMGGLTPVILGHEGVGTVLEVGNDVLDLQPGDRVIGTFQPACGTCWSCVRGRTHFCEEMVPVALRAHWLTADGSKAWSLSGLGTFAEEAIVERISVVLVESGLPAEQLALVGCGAMTGVGAVLNTAAVSAGDSVVVIGCGGVGQFVIQGARIAGAASIIAVDPVASKREAAIANGASAVVDPADGDVVDNVRDLTGGRGTDHAFEVVGTEATLLQAYAMAGNGGTVVAVGMAPAGTTVTLDAHEVFSTEKRLVGSYYGSAQVRRDFPRLVALAEVGQLDLGGAVTRCIGLDDVNDAFRAMSAGEVVRSVILPNAASSTDPRGSDT